MTKSTASNGAAQKKKHPYRVDFHMESTPDRKVEAFVLATDSMSAAETVCQIYSRSPTKLAIADRVTQLELSPCCFVKKFGKKAAKQYFGHRFVADSPEFVEIPGTVRGADISYVEWLTETGQMDAPLHAKELARSAWMAARAQNHRMEGRFRELEHQQQRLRSAAMALLNNAEYSVQYQVARTTILEICTNKED